MLQARFKKAGTAWLPGHADQIARLRVLHANDQWLPLWNQPHPDFTAPGPGNGSWTNHAMDDRVAMFSNTPCRVVVSNIFKLSL